MLETLQPQEYVVSVLVSITNESLMIKPCLVFTSFRNLFGNNILETQRKEE